MIIRDIKMNDAIAFSEMQFALDKETEFMMYEADERIKDLRRTEAFIKQSIDGGNLLLIAEENENIVGFLSAERGKLKRIHHTAYIVVGIRKTYRGQGIGSNFFKNLDEWALQNNISRLELTVMCPNQIAKHLYEKNGFVVEGMKKNAMFVNGAYIDEFYMAKMIG